MSGTACPVQARQILMTYRAYPAARQIIARETGCCEGMVWHWTRRGIPPVRAAQIIAASPLLAHVRTDKTPRAARKCSDESVHALGAFAKYSGDIMFRAFCADYVRVSIQAVDRWHRVREIPSARAKSIAEAVAHYEAQQQRKALAAVEQPRAAPTVWQRRCMFCGNAFAAKSPYLRRCDTHRHMS